MTLSMLTFFKCIFLSRVLAKLFSASKTVLSLKCSYFRLTAFVLESCLEALACFQTSSLEEKKGTYGTIKNFNNIMLNSFNFTLENLSIEKEGIFRNFSLKKLSKLTSPLNSSELASLILLRTASSGAFFFKRF